MNKLTLTILGVALLLVIGVAWLSSSKSESLLGGQTRSSFNTTGNLAASGTVTAGTGFILGSGGTSLTNVVCATTSWDPPSITSGLASSTFVTVTGATTASNQVYFAGINTSTLGLPITANVSGTSGIIIVQLGPSASGSAAINIAPATVSACYAQF